MVCTVSAGTAASYYVSEQSRYYTGGKEPVGRWYAPSASAGMADGGEIDDSTFERLHAGLDVAGNKLTQNADGSHVDRVAGYDLTFSAPKSVSIVWGLGDETQRGEIEAAHDAAVRSALGVVNDHAAFSRRGKGGAILEPVQLTGAIFQHGEARPVEREVGPADTGAGGKQLAADPQLHSHAVILNWAQRADGSWGSIDGRQLFRWKMAAGAVYRAELAARLQGLGYGIERNDEPKGLFEIAGVSKSVRDHFSGRRQGIVKAMQAHGLKTSEAPALAAEVTRAGRKSKGAMQVSDRHEGWRARADEMGFRAPQPELAVTAPEHHLAGNREILTRLTETKAVFRHQDIVTAIAADLIGTKTGAQGATAMITERVEAVLQDAEIVPLNPDQLGQKFYSTREMVAFEQELAGMAHHMKGSYFGLSPTMRHTPTLSGVPALSEEQSAAVAHACGTNRLAIVEGAAGSGKTTTLSAVAQAYQRAGYRVIGTAVAWRAALQLGEECGIGSRALDSWLVRHRDGQAVFDGKTVLVVDEAGLLSTRQMHAVLSVAQASGSKVILAGDQRQLQAIGAGSGLTIVAEQVGSQRVDTNRRQKESWARTAVSRLARGEAEPALRAFDENGCLHWAEGQKATLDMVLQLWRDGRQSHPEQSVIALAKSNADVRALNEVMRADLRQSGQVRGQDIVVRAVDRSGGAYDLAMARGDRLEIGVRNKELGLVNGMTGTVTRVEAEDNGHARLTLAVGTRGVIFSTAELADRRGRTRLGHAYATTIYNAQGLTVDRAIVIGSSGFSANQAYVAASRAKERTDIIINGKDIDRELRARARAVGDVPVHRPTMPERITQLARGWARQEVKENIATIGQIAAGRVSQNRGSELEL
jgi:hypothetical protein